MAQDAVTVVPAGEGDLAVAAAFALSDQAISAIVTALSAT